MRIGAFVLMIGLAYVSPATAEDELPMSRVRSTNLILADLVRRGSEESQTLRELIGTINATDGIVYIEDGRCRHGVRACLVTISVSGPQRVVRILVRGTGPETALIATIAHELRHAIEVLSNPRVTTTEAMQQFYLRYGSRRLGGSIETNEAIQAGERVMSELRKWRERATAEEKEWWLRRPGPL